MVVAVLLFTVLGAPASLEARKESGADALGVPLLSYNTDLGVGFGAVGGAYFYSPGYAPYRHGVAAQAFATTGGVQHHWLRYDGPSFVRGARVEARVEYRRELFAPYYGAGNLSSPEIVELGHDRRYSFDWLSAGAWMRIRGDPFGQGHPFHPFIGYAYHFNRIAAYPGSLLDDEQPEGMGGGSNGQVSTGVLWDTRDSEANASRGGLEELAVRASARPTGSRYDFGGITLSERRFFRIWGPRIVFAQRLTFDCLFGSVPFHELAHLGGLSAPEGIGGMSSVRGVPRNRFSGNLKAISNSELRFEFFGFSLFGQRTTLGGVGFFDVGRSWHPGAENGGLLRWHPGAGTGVRLARRAAVVRVDYAVATESLRQALYLTFGQLF